LGKKQLQTAKTLPPLDLHYPLWFVFMCFQRWVYSDYVALPDEGGVGDQDALLMDDLHAMLERYNAKVRLVSQEK
jgi:hypothetical protein